MAGDAEKDDSTLNRPDADNPYLTFALLVVVTLILAWGLHRMLP